MLGVTTARPVRLPMSATSGPRPQEDRLLAVGTIPLSASPILSKQPFSQVRLLAALAFVQRNQQLRVSLYPGADAQCDDNDLCTFSDVCDARLRGLLWDTRRLPEDDIWTLRSAAL